ncbi:GGDEF domain-containing protein [Acidicapsa acidisoli]|uniref:GGDEF domain-containing protein n=1 Tax=Acidicapsa acidisoli TaxID=1615681 RepID=UPI0021E08997|nr:GGDEF domain-containing protein [Acidicapsa acidisoli]
MSLLSWFDNRTLFGCQCVLAIMFATLFLCMSRVYPMVRGIRSISFAFLLGIPCTFLALSRGHISDFLSVDIANVLAAGGFILLYCGVVQFVGGKIRLWLVTVPSGLALGVVYYYSEVRPNILPRIVVMGMIQALLVGLTAWELLRTSADTSSRRANRSTARFFGILLTIQAALCVVRSVLSVILGAPNNLMQGDIVQTSTMLMNLVYLAVYGLCFLAMAGHEMIQRSQEESETDSLSGAFNRRGIELKLNAELKRSNRSQMKLSIALVDVDHFKSINDRFGHAAGDEAIRGVSLAISKCLRGVDYLGRYGGDEFLLVLPLTTIDEASIVLERVKQVIESLEIRDDFGPLTLSIGLTEASPEDDAVTLIARADEALYMAKSDGRNCMRSRMPQRTFPEAARRTDREAAKM